LQEYAYAEPWQWVDYAGRLRGALDPSVHFRHGGFANVVWCDGHVTAEAPTKVGSKNSYGGDARKWVIGWFGVEPENGAWNRSARGREVRSGAAHGVALTLSAWNPNPPENSSSNWSAKLPITPSGGASSNREPAHLQPPVAILALDMCGFSRTTRAYGIVAFLVMIHEMQQLCAPAVASRGGIHVRRRRTISSASSIP